MDITSPIVLLTPLRANYGFVITQAPGGGIGHDGNLTVTQSGLHTEITLTAGGTDLITLANVTATDIDAGDFAFV